MLRFVSFHLQIVAKQSKRLFVAAFTWFALYIHFFCFLTAAHCVGSKLSRFRKTAVFQTDGVTVNS